MTPDKDGYYVWNPGDPRPDADAICDVQFTYDDKENWLQSYFPPRDWGTPRRYRLRTQPIDLSSIRPGDEVTLKTGPYVVDRVMSTCIEIGGVTGWLDPDVIATHTPKPKSRVTDEMVEAFREKHRDICGYRLAFHEEDLRQALEAALAVKEKGE